MSSIQNIGFIGCGGIARAHAFCLQALPYYYEKSPGVSLQAVSSRNETNRTDFALKYGFKSALSPEELFAHKSLDTLFILGPNAVHYQHLKAALEMPGVKRIYLEKPVCSTADQEQAIMELAKLYPEVTIQVGFQFLLSPAIHEAINFWHSGILGEPIHFEVKYYHGDYLKSSYREKRKTRLTPAPDGGAMADLGSHAISLLMAFLGEKVTVTNALQGGSFPDVTATSDLFSSISLYYPKNQTVGTLSASRISSGTGDTLSIEIYAEKGTLKYSSLKPDFFEYFLESDSLWHKKVVGSQYENVTSFPSGHVPPGWLRSMMHAQYVFLGGKDSKAFVPDIRHGLAVQRIVREAADAFDHFRHKK